MLSTQDFNSTAASTSLQAECEEVRERLLDRAGEEDCLALHASSNPAFDLLEHQAKQLFRDVGIPVLSSRLVASASELKTLSLEYPFVLKPQLHGAGEENITKITNSIDAITAAHRLFDSSIEGKYPEHLLAETFYPSQSQIGLALCLDPERDCLQLQAWRCCSMHCDSSVPERRTKMYSLDANAEFSEAQAEKLGQALGLQGKELAAWADILEKMYVLQASLGLALVAIDPLAINAEGDMVVLNGKIRFTEIAVEQQPQLRKLFSPKPEVAPPVVHLGGNIGIVSNGMGAALTAIDSLKQAGGEPAAFVSLKEGVGTPVRRRKLTATKHSNEQFRQALDSLARLKDVKLILVNWNSLSTSCQEVAKTIADYFHRASQQVHIRGLRQPVPLVVCLEGPEAKAGRDLLENMGIVAVGSLEEAIAEGVDLAKVRMVS